MEELNKVLIFIPSDGSYIEILGHKIDFQGGWENFLEYLKELERNKQRIEKAISYIEEQTKPDYQRELCWDMYDTQIFELLKILKGEQENHSTNQLQD